MTDITEKWYSGILKDYTCSLVWSKDVRKTFLLLHSLLKNCHGETEILTYRRNAAWGRPVTNYNNVTELQRGIEKLINHDNNTHITFVLDLDTKLTPDQQKALDQFISTNREHNVTLIVMCKDLEYLGESNFSFDLVFHCSGDQSGDTQYQKWINYANKEGVLLTQSLCWLGSKDPEHITEFSILGVYVLSL